MHLKLYLSLGVAICMAFATSHVFGAATKSEGFLTAIPVQPGWLVSADPNPGMIQAANVKNADRLIGVVLSPQNAIFTITTKANETQVATEGIIPTVVSTVNGDIKVGDKITASQISGVGMKVKESAKVIGVAQASLDAKSTYAVKTKLKNTDGKEQEVNVGQIPVLISISYFTLGEGKKSLVPSFLQGIANSVAGRNVSTFPIIISMVIFLVVMLTSGLVLYAAIRSSIISVGRNPLSKRGVTRSLIQVSIMVLLLIASGLVAIYFVLRLV